MGALRLIRESDDRGRPDDVDILGVWRAYMLASGVSVKSVDLRIRVIESLMRHAGVRHPLDLTRELVIAWLARDVKPWTRLLYWKVAGGFSAFLREFCHDPDPDLVKGIPKPPTPQPVARPIDDATIERLLALKLSGRAHVYVRLALYQAMRVHEIAKVRGEDFDRAAGWLMITGKGGVTRPIPIHPEVAKICDRMPEIGYWFPASGDPSRSVLPGGVSTTITAALKMAGSTATAHQLRDTAATRMQRTTKDIRVTQALLRHSNITSTMKYTAACNDDLEQAVRGMDWADTAQQEQAPALDLAALTVDELRTLSEQLARLAAERRR